MIAASQVRTAPNKGRYLFHNPLLHILIGNVDRLLETVKKPSKEALVITPKKILVCCQAHIGDALMATSVLPVLTAAFPNAKIGFLIHPGSIDVFTDNPKVTWVHTFNHWKLNRQKQPFWKKFLSYAQSRSQALKEIKVIEYDLAIDLYPYFPNSIALLFSAHVPYRIGWTSAGLGGLLTHALDWEFSSGHVVDRHKRLLATLKGCDSKLPLAKPEIHTSEEIKQQWTEIAKKFSIPDNFLAFHIGAGGIHRRWPTTNWIQLASLCVNAGESIVLLGHGDEEQAICREIADTTKNVHDLSGMLNWRLMTETIGRSKLLVGLESASGHIAAASDKPSVSIYSGTAQASMWRPYHPSAKVISHSVPCSPCYMSEGCEGMECVRLVTPRLVFCETHPSVIENTMH
jgi:ADP-heptose:LPS heptosyltransferase